MAKKQVFGEKVLAAKAAQRKMAKVIISRKTSRGKVSFQESILEQNQVSEYLSRKNS